MALALSDALARLRPLLLDESRLVRALAGGARRGEDPAWKRVELRPVALKAGARLQIVRFDERQAFTANEPWGETAAQAVDGLLALPFGHWHVETLDEILQLKVTKKGDALLSCSRRATATDTGGIPDTLADADPDGSGPADAPLTPPPAAAAPSPGRNLAHDRVKPRLLAEADPLWEALGLADAQGRIKPTRTDKYRQVEEFLRALDAALGEISLPSDRPLRVVDLGCGNAYLTFAAWRYLTHVRRLAVQMVGVDSKAQARERNSALAARLGWTGLTFLQGSIAAAPVDGADVVLALHACDTATDDALARAIAWKARLILAAPCCHHDLQRQLRQGGAAAGPFGLVTRHGILRERFGDVLTDALRAALLRLNGYRTEVIEFVPSEHTPRNTLLRAIHTGAPGDPAVRAEYEALTRDWNLRPKLADLLAGAGF